MNNKEIYGNAANDMFNLLNDIGECIIKLYIAATFTTYYFESDCNPACGIDEDTIKQMLFGAMRYVSSLGLIDHQKLLESVEEIIKRN